MRRLDVYAGMLFFIASLSGCGGDKPAAEASAPTEVGVIAVSLRDVPVTFEYVGQTESSQQVEIRARVNGFLEERVYKEGSMVHAGDVMFRMDRKPFEAALESAQAEMNQQRARLDTAQANLNRVRPLAAKNALSQKDLDDATGQQQAAAAALEEARANVTTAQLNLGYTTITSPVTGLSSFAKRQDGSYIDSANSLLTYVAKLDPMWVNFTLSENELLRMREQTTSGALKLPGLGLLEVEIVLADGSVFPTRGRIAFSDASLNTETGTYLVRAEFDNREGHLRPGQFVRVKVLGAERTKAISVPQEAVQQGEQGSFVWTVTADGKAQPRLVEIGEWNGTDWIVNSGLHAGDQVVVDNFIRLAPGAPVKTHPAKLPATAAPKAVAKQANAAVASTAPGAAPSDGGAPSAQAHAGTKAALLFDVGSAQISEEAASKLAPIAAQLHASSSGRAVISGYADASGSHEANLKLAAARAKAVRAALLVAGVAENRIELRPPADITAGTRDEARRVEVTVVPEDKPAASREAQ